MQDDRTPLAYTSEPSAERGVGASWRPGGVSTLLSAAACRRGAAFMRPGALRTTTAPAYRRELERLWEDRRRNSWGDASSILWTGAEGCAGMGRWGGRTSRNGIDSAWPDAIPAC